MPVCIRAALASFALYGLTQAASATVIGNFEGGLDVFSNIGTAGLSVDTSTSTLGASSLLVTDTNTGWSQSIKADLSSVWASDVAAGGVLSLDIKAAGGAPTVPAWWLQMIPVLNSENGGWTQGSFTPDVTLNNQWQTVSWTFPAMPAAPGGWAELFIISNSGDARTYNIDNVRLVVAPEPATAGALLAGVTALIRRRR